MRFLNETEPFERAKKGRLAKGGGGELETVLVHHWEGTRSDINWGFEERLLNDKFAFFEASKNPIPKRRNLLAKRPFL